MDDLEYTWYILLVSRKENLRRKILLNPKNPQKNSFNFIYNWKSTDKFTEFSETQKFIIAKKTYMIISSHQKIEYKKFVVLLHAREMFLTKKKNLFSPFFCPPLIKNQKMCVIFWLKCTAINAKISHFLRKKMLHLL